MLAAYGPILTVTLMAQLPGGTIQGKVVQAGKPVVVDQAVFFPASVRFSKVAAHRACNLRYLRAFFEATVRFAVQPSNESLASLGNLRASFAHRQWAAP
jgi:hypothetical protein